MSKVLDTVELIFHYLAHHDDNTSCPKDCRVCELEQEQDHREREKVHE